MKRNKLLRITVLLLFFAPILSFSQKKDAFIRLIQDESIPLNDFQTNVTLKKKSFKFQIMLQNISGIYVFASIEDSIYRFTEESPIRDFPYLKLLELKDEDHFNINKELNISETGWSYWFYGDTTGWHSFDRKVVGIGDKRIVCTKAIKELYDVENEKQIKLKSLDRPLYIFFVAIKEYDEDGKPVAELMRRKIKINWKGSD